MSKGMTGSDIARELGITRQAVSQTLRLGVKKLYHEILRQRIADSPFDAVVAMMIAFGIHEATQEEVVDFLFLLPNEIRRDVKNDAKFNF